MELGAPAMNWLGLTVAALIVLLLLIVNCVAYYRDNRRLSADERAKWKREILSGSIW